MHTHCTWMTYIQIYQSYHTKHELQCTGSSHITSKKKEHMLHTGTLINDITVMLRICLFLQHKQFLDFPFLCTYFDHIFSAQSLVIWFSNAVWCDRCGSCIHVYKVYNAWIGDYNVECERRKQFSQNLIHGIMTPVCVSVCLLSPNNGTCMVVTINLKHHLYDLATISK